MVPRFYVPSLVEMAIFKGRNTTDSERGHIHDIRFQDVAVTSRAVPPSRLSGYDVNHLIEKVTVEDLCINGRRLTTLAEGGFKHNEFVREVTFR